MLIVHFVVELIQVGIGHISLDPSYWLWYLEYMEYMSSHHLDLRIDPMDKVNNWFDHSMIGMFLVNMMDKLIDLLHC